MTSETVSVLPTRRIGYDLLRIISICGVIAIHTFGPIAANPDLHGSFTWLMALIFSDGFIWAVPVFVMIAGALSLRERAHAEGPTSFLLRRAARIVPALMAWTVIYLVIVRMLILREPITPAAAFIELLDARVYPHLYFLWLIAGLYLVAPVLAAFLHGGGRRRAVVTGAIVLGATLVIFMVPAVLALKDISRPITLGALTLWIAYVGYFVVGFALSLLRVSRAWLVVAALGIPLFGAITLAETAWPERLTVVRAFFLPEYLGVGVAALSVCVFVVGVTLLDLVRAGERFMRFVVTLSQASFGVYLVHLVLMLIPYNLLPGYHARTSLFEGVIAYVFVIVLSFAISIGANKVPGLRAIF